MVETILSRRSERNYTGETIPKEDLKKILECGFAAPSAHNKQPWSFYVTNDKEKFQKVMDVQPYTKFLKGASHAVFVLADKTKDGTFWRDDCAAATQNLLLGAHALGYGACWCAITPVSKFTKAMGEILDMPENIKVYSMVVLGVKKTTRNPHKSIYKEDLVIWDD